MKTGTIFKIQKYSIHDGPGIRTTIFLKGCPLSCRWCHNPEGQQKNQTIIYHENQCTYCGRCIEACTHKALSFGGSDIKIDEAKCSKCFHCANGCVYNALELIGSEMSVEQVMDIINKDIIFYDESGGGATFSGGEPFFQDDFLLEILKECKKQGINTAVETSGFTQWAKIEKVSAYVDFFLYDLKLMREDKHKKFTGVSNQLILENLKKLSMIHNEICVRIPVIPGINDDKDNILGTGLFLKSININNVHILPYHTAGVYKYERLGMDYSLDEIKTPTEKEMKYIGHLFEDIGCRVKIGG